MNILKYVKQFASYIFYAAMMVLAVLMLAKFTGFFVSSARADKLVIAASELAKTSSNDNKNPPGKSKEIADTLKKRNLFVPAAQKQHPVSEVTGIFGSEALINGNWYREGDNIQDAQIVAIEPAKVRIKWQDQIKTFEPITSGPASGQGPMQAGVGGASRPTASSARSTIIQGQPDRGFGRFGGMSEEQMAQMREMRQRFENMSDSEREQFMRDRFGGMGGPGGRGPRGGMGGPQGSNSDGGGGGRGGRGNRGD